MPEWERVQDQSKGLSVRWRKVSGELELRIFHAEEHVVLVARKMRRGRVPEYIYWRGFTSEEAAMFDAEELASFT
jgi:hypothetical protein